MTAKPLFTFKQNRKMTRLEKARAWQSTSSASFIGLAVWLGAFLSWAVGNRTVTVFTQHVPVNGTYYDVTSNLVRSDMVTSITPYLIVAVALFALMVFANHEAQHHRQLRRLERRLNSNPTRNE